MAKVVAGSLTLIPSSVFFLLIQTRCIFDVCTLGSIVDFTSSLIAGMRGARAAVKPHDANEKTMWKNWYCMITVPRKGPLPVTHTFRRPFGRMANSWVWRIRHWGGEAYSNPSYNIISVIYIFRWATTSSAVWLSAQGAAQHSAATREQINQKITNEMQEESIWSHTFCKMNKNLKLSSVTSVHEWVSNSFRFRMVAPMVDRLPSNANIARITSCVGSVGLGVRVPSCVVRMHVNKKSINRKRITTRLRAPNL